MQGGNVRGPRAVKAPFAIETEDGHRRVCGGGYDG